MNFFKLIIKSLKCFKKQNFAVFAGTMISTAVLTGALIIGDSVKYSLKNLVDLRLGKIEYALPTGDRFITKKLVDKLNKNANIEACAALITSGTASNQSSQKKANNVQIIGVDSTFWNLAQQKPTDIHQNEVLINEAVAKKLEIKPGDEIIIRANNLSEIPINAPFAEEDNTNISFRTKVAGIVSNKEFGRFSLKSNQNTLYNIFIDYDFLSNKLDINKLSNTLLFSGNKQVSKDALQKSLETYWSINDAELKIKESNEIEVKSNRIFIENRIVSAVDKSNLPKQSILTYLVNSIQSKTGETPYSFVTASDIPEFSNVFENEIIINQWLADDLKVKTNDSLDLKYFVIGPLRKLEERSTKFIVKEIFPLKEDESLKNLMPEFPGITESSSCREWETGIPIDLDKIRDKDEDYWDLYRGTPKAFISLKKGQKLWGNQFGNYTAFRFENQNITSEQVQTSILANLKPIDLGLDIQEVRKEGITAAENSVDFAGLFLGMSFFVIISGILLTVLLYALNAQKRNSEAGLLAAIGFRKKSILRFRILEALFITILGAIAGALLGILYNKGIMLGLNSVWNDIVRTDTISMHIKPLTLLLGTLIGITIAIISIFLVVRKQQKGSIINALRENQKHFKLKSKRKLNALLSIVLIIGALSMVFYSITSDSVDNSGLFLSAGGAFMLGLIFLSAHFLNKDSKDNNLSFNNLALKNTKRNKNRSLGTIALLAIGTFSILITAANRKTFVGDDSSRSSGAGGYTYWAETTTPLLHDLNTPRGKEEYNLDADDFKGVRFMQIYSLTGDDASCLNLNQVQKPQILGVNSKELSENKSFTFAKKHKDIKSNADWNMLQQDLGASIIPTIADQTVLTWGLKKKVGDTLTYLNEKGTKIHLLIVGSLAASVFQGNLLIDSDKFIENYPSSGGSNIMLVEAPQESKEKVKDILENTFLDHGIEVTATTERLATFYSITNTYLALFLALGGLGVIIGTIGLGIVIFRNILDRKRELASMQALGFRKKQIFKLIFRENFVLLISGILIGLLSAVIGILSSLLSPSFTIPGGFVIIVILGVFASGLLWIYFPTKISMKSKLIEALREE